MNEISDKIFDKYITQNNHCCAAIYKSALESRGITVDDEECLKYAGFSGGLSVGDSCGSLTGGILAIGALIHKGDEESFHIAKKATVEYYKRFEEEIGSTKCKENKLLYRRQPGMRCITLVEKAAQVLNEVLKKYGA